MFKLLSSIGSIIDHAVFVYACPVLDVIIIIYLAKLHRVLTEILKEASR